MGWCEIEVLLERKYIECEMSVGPIVNIMVIAKQHFETEKVKTIDWITILEESEKQSIQRK